MFLGSDAVLLDGMELGSQPTGLRLPDLQPVAGPPAASGPPRAQPPHLATSRRLLPDGDRAIIYRQQCFSFFTLLEHMELTLSLERKARHRALAKARRLLQDAPSHDAEPDRT